MSTPTGAGELLSSVAMLGESNLGASLQASHDIIGVINQRLEALLPGVEVQEDGEFRGALARADNLAYRLQYVANALEYIAGLAAPLQT